MKHFTNNQSLLERAESLLGKPFHMATGKYSGKFGSDFMSRLEIKEFLTKKGECDFPRYNFDLKTTTRAHGRTTLFELTDDKIFKWVTDPFKFLRKYGVDELGDGYTRVDRKLTAKMGEKYLCLYYDGIAIAKVPSAYILHRFNIKLRGIILIEAGEIAPRVVKPYRLSIIENPPFTIERISTMLQQNKLRIESRIKTNKQKHLVHRFIFRMTPDNIKTMTSTTKTATVSKDIDALDCAINLGGEIYESVLPKGYSITYPSGKSNIDAIVKIDGKEYKVSMRLEYLTPAKANEYLITIDNCIQRNKKTKNIQSLKLAFEKGRQSLAGNIVFFDGHLVDGQNRCWAVIASKVPLPVWVFTSDDATIFQKLDTGTARNFGDRNRRVDNKIGAAISFVLRYDVNTITAKGGGIVKCRSDQDDYYKTHMKSLTEALVIAKSFGPKPVLSPTIIMSFLELARRKSKDKDVVVEFIRKLITNDGLKAGTTLHTLREWLYKSNIIVPGHRRRPELPLCQIIAAWNAYQTKMKFCPIRGKNGTIVKCPRLYWEIPKVSEPITTGKLAET